MSNRRRSDRVLDPSFVDSLDGLDLAVLRDRLNEARREEEAVSYVRRLLHGRLDLMRAEAARRSGGEEAPPSAALQTSGGGGRGARARIDGSVAESEGRRRAEQIISEAHLARLPELGDAEIEQAVAKVVEAETEISEVRHALHGVIDALEAELASRYRSGAAPPL